VTEAFGKAGAYTREARKKETIIIRYHPDGTREDIPVDIEKILKNQAPDVILMPNDILYAPPNKTKAALNRTLEGAISVVTGRLIYHF